VAAPRTTDTAAAIITAAVLNGRKCQVIVEASRALGAFYSFRRAAPAPPPDVEWKDMQEFVHPAVAAYLAGLAPTDDTVLAAVRARSAEDGVPALSGDTAWLLHVIASAARPARIFEIGTGYGYSGLQLARALAPGGVLFTVERDAARAAIAREHFAQAGVADRVNVMVGEAVRLVHKVAGPFDVIVQDGSKDQYEATLDRLIDLLRPNGVLFTDNILWHGDVIPGFRTDAAHAADSAAAISRFSRRLAADARLETTFLPVGDGVALSVKRDAPGSPASP
jgi:predicted O-methyltransferase YrrM